MPHQAFDPLNHVRAAMPAANPQRYWTKFLAQHPQLKRAPSTARIPVAKQQLRALLRDAFLAGQASCKSSRRRKAD